MRKMVAKHREAAFGLFPSDFVLNHIPMLREKSVLDPNNVRGDPVTPLAKTEIACTNDEISSATITPGQLECGRQAADEVKSPSRPGVMWALCWI